MKVYGTMLMVRGATSRYGRGAEQVRCIVAAKNQKEAAYLFRMSVYEFRNFGCETGNAEEIATATAEPGVVFYRDEHGDKKLHRKAAP